MSFLAVNQHYVWRYYLNAWARSSKIWCKRLDKAAPFCTSTRNIASQRFFYEFQELTVDDLNYLERVISKSADEKLRELNRGWIHQSQVTFSIRNQLQAKALDPTIRCRLETDLQIIERTMGERLHGITEDRAIPILNALRRGDATFYEHQEFCIDFVHFIALQYFRTARMKNIVMSIDNRLPHDVSRTWPIEAFIYATNVGASLFAQRHQYRIKFIYNKSNVPYITGDQPIINLNNAEDTEVLFFYPLSPNLAMTFGPSEGEVGIDDIPAIVAERYNYKMYVNSDNQIYGDSQSYLEDLSRLPKDKSLL